MGKQRSVRPKGKPKFQVYGSESLKPWNRCLKKIMQKTQANVAKFDGHSGAVTDISFSENGYFLATAGYDGVKLWDLRKLKNLRTFTPYDSNTPTNSVQFDHSGSYFAIVGSDIRVYQVSSVKQEWNSIKTFPDLSGTGKASCVRFGPDASYLAVGTGDRNLRIFGSPDAASEA